MALQYFFPIIFSQPQNTLIEKQQDFHSPHFQGRALSSTYSPITPTLSHKFASLKYAAANIFKEIFKNPLLLWNGFRSLFNRSNWDI